MHTVQPLSARRGRSVSATLCVLGLLLFAPAQVRAQDKTDAERTRAMQFYEANNFVEAQPLLEKLAAANPADVVVQERLGYALLANATLLKDPAARAAMRERARAALMRARALGDDSNLLQYALDVLNAPDAASIPFSQLQEADKAMREGETAFANGALDKAISAYERALKLDPQLYPAALFIGDSYFKQHKLDKAGEWFARAVAIDANRETAYRYWGDALVGADKRDEARDKFIEAIIAEPFNRTPYMGLTQWAQKYQINVAHPKIEVPTSVTPLKDDKLTINIDPKSLADPGSGTAWMMYGLTRASWATEKFAKEFPQEKTYRHSLREEVEALRAVVVTAKQQQKDGKLKRLEPSLANLIKLADADLLEPYVLFAHPDRGVAQDYAAYRRSNRDKLHRYWLEFVVGNTN